jgi:hypothetical protein
MAEGSDGDFSKGKGRKLRTEKVNSPSAAKQPAY